MDYKRIQTAALTDRYADRVRTIIVRQIPVCICSLFIVLFSSCAISYKFNGASIDYSTTKSISVADFPNNAALVYPPLSSMLSETIRELYQRQTRLQVNRKGGDLEVEGEITGYELTPMSISTDSYSAETKLTMTVRVRFISNVAPEDSFERTYSAFQVFDSSQMLTDVQEELCTQMVKEISESIYNDTVARW